MRTARPRAVPHAGRRPSALFDYIEGWYTPPAAPLGPRLRIARATSALMPSRPGMMVGEKPRAVEPPGSTIAQGVFEGGPTRYLGYSPKLATVSSPAICRESYRAHLHGVPLSHSPPPKPGQLHSSRLTAPTRGPLRS